MKRILSITLLSGAAILYHCQAAAQSVTDTLKEITIKVTNLHCGNDMPTIKKKLLNEPGVEEIRFTDIAGETSVFTIRYHTSAISQGEIEKAIESTPGCDNKDETPYRVKHSRTRKRNP